MAEQLIRNEQVVSSILTISSNPELERVPGFFVQKSRRGKLRRPCILVSEDKCFLYVCSRFRAGSLVRIIRRFLCIRP